MYFSQQNHALNVFGVGKHVHGLNLCHAVAVGSQVIKIARERLRVAGDVHDALRRETAQRREKPLVAACARRVEDDHVGALARLCHALQELPGVGGIKAHVAGVILLCVSNRVAHGVAVVLHADDLPGAAAGKNADGAGAAVGVDHRLRAGQPGKLQRLAVEHLRLHGIDLVKRARRDAEREFTELLVDRAGAVEHLAVRAEHETRLPAVDVVDNGGDLRVALQQGFDEVALAGKHTPPRHEHDHDLPAAKSALDEHVPQRAAPGVLVIGLNLEAAHQVANGANDAVGHRVLDHAVADRDDPVRRGLVHAGDDLPLPVAAKRGLHLVPVVVGVLHAENFLHMEEAAEQADLLRLFEVQLLFIAQILQLAAAAFFRKRADGVACRGLVRFWHGFQSPILFGMSLEYHKITPISTPTVRAGGSIRNARRRSGWP